MVWLILQESPAKQSRKLMASPNHHIYYYDKAVEKRVRSRRQLPELGSLLLYVRRDHPAPSEGVARTQYDGDGAARHVDFGASEVTEGKVLYSE